MIHARPDPLRVGQDEVVRLRVRRVTPREPLRRLAGSIRQQVDRPPRSGRRRCRRDRIRTGIPGPGPWSPQQEGRPAAAARGTSCRRCGRPIRRRHLRPCFHARMERTEARRWRIRRRSPPIPRAAAQRSRRGRPPRIAPSEPAARTRPSDEPSRPGRASTARRARSGEGALIRTEAGKNARNTLSSIPPRPARAPGIEQAKHDRRDGRQTCRRDKRRPHVAEGHAAFTFSHETAQCVAKREPREHGRDHRRPRHERRPEERREHPARGDLVGETPRRTARGSGRSLSRRACSTPCRPEGRRPCGGYRLARARSPSWHRPSVRTLRHPDCGAPAVRPGP